MIPMVPGREWKQVTSLAQAMVWEPAIILDMEQAIIPTLVPVLVLIMVLDMHMDMIQVMVRNLVQAISKQQQN